MKEQKTFSPKPGDLKREWKLINAEGHSAGRLASETAKILQGKHKTDFAPHLDNGDFVVIINTDQMILTGKKWTDKKYYRHSRFPGSLKEWSPKDIGTDEILRMAVQGMLPKNKLRKRLIKKLKIYKKSEYEQEAQKPEEYKIKTGKK